ncbi:MAG TPA: hypothetical protein VK580_06405 [Steroidobacteraceae bacterium]|nr:hypothetical protein [Steroidobacteraceae bacterium]
MHSSNLGFQSKFVTLAVALLLVTLWLLMHGYHGLTGDGQIYAFQAFARLHPQLTADLYLQNTSQDQFTLFSPLYACCIGLLGLENAARLLTLVFTVWLLAATWSFARAVADRDAAWLTVAFLLIVAGDYGGSRVFQILDPFLTARLPGEALIITALACHVRGMKWLSLALALGALFVHPLMALPGLLLIVGLWLPVRVGVIGAIGGIMGALGIAIVSTNLPTTPHVLTVMDAPWLDVVQERSQFLFLQLWSIHDWDINAQPFISLGFTAVAVADERIRKLCAAAALVGAAGLAVAFIGGLIGPVAIFVQGQAWRWVWIAVFISVVFVPFTALQVWRDEACGPLCALSLVLGWTMPGVGGSACMALALIIWLTRVQISSRLGTHFRWVSAGLGIAIGVWILVKFWVVLSAPTSPSGRMPSSVVQTQGLFGLKMPAVLLVALTWWGIRVSKRTWVPVLLSTMLLALSVCAFPAAFKQARTLAATWDIDEFADWKKAISPTSTVLVTPPRDVGAFVWFTLGRPNYLSLDQSSGVVFSQTTALEVRRRSEVLLPLMDPEWMIRASLRAKSGGDRQNKATSRPLTTQNLAEICRDPQLGFVASPERVGFDPLRHLHDGAWKDWNLYDCRKVR